MLIGGDSEQAPLDFLHLRVSFRVRCIVLLDVVHFMSVAASPTAAAPHHHMGVHFVAHIRAGVGPGHPPQGVDPGVGSTVHAHPGGRVLYSRVRPQIGKNQTRPQVRCCSCLPLSLSPRPPKPLQGASPRGGPDEDCKAQKTDTQREQRRRKCREGQICRMAGWGGRGEGRVRGCKEGRFGPGGR